MTLDAIGVVSIIAALCTGVSVVVSPASWFKTAPGSVVMLSIPFQGLTAILHISDVIGPDKQSEHWVYWVSLSLLLGAIAVRPFQSKKVIREMGDD